MAIAASQVGWGKYKEYEGPMFFGVVKPKITPDSPPAWIRTKVISASEGNLDAGQCYDMCRGTFGFQQWCGLFPMLVKMIRSVNQQAPGTLSSLFDFLGSINTKISDTSDYFIHKGVICRGDTGLRDLFLAGGNGLRGQWQEIHRERAIGWILAYANCDWSDPRASKAQIDYAASTLMSYVNPGARWLFNEQQTEKLSDEQKKVAEAMRAIFLSCAANNPTRAETYLRLGEAKTQNPRWSMGWLVDLLRAEIWDPGVDILPHRYNTIRPVVEKAYKIDLPDFAEEFRTAEQSGNAPMSTIEAQKKLLALGFDLGPKGADGIWGNKTALALREFQRSKGLVVDGILGPQTRKALQAS